MKATRRRRGVRAAVPARVGVDTGGTFTDFVALIGGRRVAFKLPSTPRAPDRAPAEGLARLGVARETLVRYGSTLATNTLLERRGARVVLVTTAGFEDLIEIGRQDRPDLYARAPRRVEPLVPAARRIGVPERIGPGGAVWRRLTPAAIAAAVRAVRRARPEAIAVGLLHAYADPRHERRLARALAALGVPVTASAELCREFREYERLATAVTNAYVQPRVATHLRRLAAATPARLSVVLSHGGTATVAEAAREPVRQLLSGPAAGLVAARREARGCGFDRALTLDVGGTSTDCAYLEGSLPRRRGRDLAGFPVQLPLLDVHTIGAGGGSIARVDAGGLLRVGPESAGADPGPAAYGGGGPATLTDALLALGRLPVARLAGGLVALDRDAAVRALEPVARALGRVSVARAAAGVVAVAESAMAAALRRVSVERGHDPRGAALVAFGGAGGLHACACAEAIGCRAVIFPRHAGVLSALGALIAGERREASRTVLLDAGDVGAATRALDELERRCRRGFASADRRRVRCERWVEARYRGQAHELALPWSRDLATRFHVAHRERFGFDDPEATVEVVTLEVRGSRPDAPLPVERRRRLAGGASDGDSARGDAAGVASRGRVTVHHGGRVLVAPVGPHPDDPDWRARGPAFVLQDGATLWIPPGWRATSHEGGAVVAERSGR